MMSWFLVKAVCEFSVVKVQVILYEPLEQYESYSLSQSVK